MARKHTARLAVAGLIMVLGACSTGGAIQSLKLSQNPTSKGVTGGPVYYLPYTVLEIEGAPCLAAEAAAAKSADAKPAASPATVVTVDARPTATATATASGAQQDPAPKPSTGNGQAEKCDPKSPDAQYGFKIKSLTLADTTHAYQAAINQQGFSSDQPKITVSAGGLLSSASATSKDETREAIVAFGEAVGSVVGLGAGFKHNNYSALVSISPTLQAFPIKLQGKPKPSFKALCPVYENDRVECDVVSQSDSGVKVEVTFPGDRNGAPNSNADACLKSSDGLCFRSRIERRVQVKASLKVDDDLVDAGGVITRVPVPDAVLGETITLQPVIDVAHSYSVAVPRKAMTKSVTTLAFDQGVLTSLEGDYPSTGGAVLSLPADFIGAVASGIGDILSIRIENSQGQVELLKAQADLLAAQQALEEARTAANEADD